MIRILILALIGIVAALGYRSRARLVTWGAHQVEKARRFPVPVLRTPERVSAVRDGAKIATRRLRATVLQRIDLGTESPVVALAEQEGVLFAGTFDDGVFRVEGRAPSAQPQTRAGSAPKGDGSAPAGQRLLAVDARVNDLAIDSNGALIVATGGGAFEVTREGVATRFARGAFSAVAIWRGQTWLASRRGLSVREKKGLWTRGPEQGLGADLPGALAGCGEVLCIGASDGLWLFDGEQAVRHSSASGDLPADWVTAVGGVEDELWAGTFDGGLAVLGPEPGLYTPGAGLPEGRIAPHALAPLGHTMVAGTPRGLLVVGDEASLISDGPLGEGVSAVIPAGQGGLWVGGRGQVRRIEVAP